MLTITKALNKTTNCTYRAKKVEGHDPKKFFTPRRAGSVPPLTFAPDWCPQFQIRSGATADTRDFYDTGATCLLSRAEMCDVIKLLATE